MLLFSDGLITCLSVFHQSLGLNEPLLSLSASLSFTFCLEIHFIRGLYNNLFSLSVHNMESKSLFFKVDYFLKGSKLI